MLRLSEVARELGISTATAYRWADRGRIPSVRDCERGRFVPRVALEAWIAAQAEDAIDNLTEGAP